MAFPTTRLIDKFNRADGPLGNGWATATDFDGQAPTILNNRVIGGSGYHAALWPTVYGPSAEARVRVPVAGDGSTFFGVLGGVVGDTGYSVAYVPGAEAVVRLIRYDDAETPVTLDEDAWGTFSDGDGVGWQRDGDKVRALIFEGGEWLPILEVEDTTYMTAGKVGLHMFDPGGWSIMLDDFGGGNLGTPGTVPSSISSPRALGIAETGRTITCNPGEWVGSPSFDYQWQRNLTDLPGEESATYELVEDDESEQVRCRVTAYNASGVQDAYTQVVESIVSTVGMEDTLVAVDGEWVPVKQRVATGGQWVA